MANIYLYVPNLIGYVRVVATIISYFIAFDSPSLFLALYGIAFLLDAADGYAARALKQCSTFGALLDMVTDRFATAGLVMLLSHMYPRYLLCFVLLNGLDLVSHFVRMYASQLYKSSSHKNVDATANPLLRIYYGNRYFLAGCCMGQEAFYLALYLFHFELVPQCCRLLVYPIFAVFAVKQLTNVLQMIDGVQKVVAFETQPPKAH